MRIPFQKLNCSCRVRRPRIWDAPEQGDPSHQVKSNSSKRAEHQSKEDGRKNPHAMRNASPRHQPVSTLPDTFWQIHGPCHVLGECQAKQTGRTREEPMGRRACLRVVCKFGRRRQGAMTLLAKERKREAENWRHATAHGGIGRFNWAPDGAPRPRNQDAYEYEFARDTVGGASSSFSFNLGPGSGDPKGLGLHRAA